jgi:hypothetical protein
MERILARIAECERRINWLVEQLRALLRHLRRVEQAVRELPDAALNLAGQNGNGGVVIIPAMTGVGGIPISTGTLGSATVTVYTIVAGVWTATTQTATCLNSSLTGAVGGSKRIWFASDGTNNICIWEDC